MNKLAVLPEGIFNNHGIVGEINLAQNNLSTLPSFDGCHNLNKLSLFYNNFTRLPATLFKAIE